MIRSADHARDVLADALWWLKGFAAAKQDTTAESLADGLSELRMWVASMEVGSVCRLGEETGIVLRFCDFEKFIDAIRIRPDGKEEHLAALEVIDRVMAQYRSEERAARGEEALF